MYSSDIFRILSWAGDMYLFVRPLIRGRDTVPYPLSLQMFLNLHHKNTDYEVCSFTIPFVNIVLKMITKTPLFFEKNPASATETTNIIYFHGMQNSKTNIIINQIYSPYPPPPL